MSSGCACTSLEKVDLLCLLKITHQVNDIVHKPLQSVLVDPDATSKIDSAASSDLWWFDELIHSMYIFDVSRTHVHG